MKKLLLIFLFSLPLLCLGQETINHTPITFEGIRSGNQIEIHWITTSEIDNDYYTLWSSTDGKEWSKLYTISNKKANDSEYWYNLESPLNLYFKLTQNNYDKSIINMGSILVDGDKQENLNYKYVDFQGKETTIENKGFKVQYLDCKFNRKIYTR